MDVTEDDTVWLLKQAFLKGLRTIDDAISGHGVTTAQLGMLARLIETPGLSGAELARRLLITPQGAQLGLVALEKRGLVRRERDPDHGRIQRAYPTAKGRTVTTAAQRDGQAGSRAFFDRLDAQEHEHLRHLLIRLLAPSDD